MARRRKSHFKFTEKKHSKKGIMALVLALFMLFGYAGALIASGSLGGGGSVYLGAAGIFALLGTLVSFVLALQSLGEENSFKLFPRLAALFSLLALLSWGGTYVIGFTY